MRKFNVNVNGKSYYVEVEEADGNVQPVAAPAVVPSVVPSTPVKPQVQEGGIAVKAPMPGLVLRFAVQNGASVNKGDKIIILEAMKMETEVVASASGKVTFVVKQGDNVESDADLAFIK